ncbi:MAG TPA: SDR family oxidoreductase [Terriglobia bacterium]|jgi:nucleoside-diphosphate-sugar epimerase
MSKPKKIFITGATGFLGSHLTARLLEIGHHVTALARGSKNTSAETRVKDVLHDVGTSRFDQLSVLEGDISLPDLGLSEASRKPIIASTDETWHCAASLSFQPEDRDEIFRMNVGGTRHVLDFVKQTPTRRLQHVSTAYIAGNRPDVALETEIDVGQGFKNPYEESKCQAELLIAAENKQAAIVASIYRPSIVIGDSRSGRATHFHGVYAFIRALWSAIERLRRRKPEAGLVHLPLRVLGAEAQTLNFVPIDYVVNGMIGISEKSCSVGGTFHLANPIPTENRLWLPNVCRVIGVEGIRLVGEKSFLKTPMTKLEALFQKQMAFYYQYLQGEPRFDCRRAVEALSSSGVECPRMTVELIDKMVGWYVNALNAKAV